VQALIDNLEVTATSCRSYTPTESAPFRTTVYKLLVSRK